VDEPKPSFLARFFLAYVAWFRTVLDADFAEGVVRLRRGQLPANAGTDANAQGPTSRAPAPKPVILRETSPEAALQLLGILQQEGRFVDFLEEDMSGFSDAEIGAAARVVHEGCRRAVREHVTLEPVRSEGEGARITLGEGFDAASVRLTGNVVGQAPFTGELRHRGWRATRIALPKVTQGHDVAVLAPAEVEL